MKTVPEIIDGLGHKAIAERLKTAATRVYRVRFETHIPASWYVVLSDMAGQDLPRNLFSFKGLDTQGETK